MVSPGCRGASNAKANAQDPAVVGHAMILTMFLSSVRGEGAFPVFAQPNLDAEPLSDNLQRET